MKRNSFIQMSKLHNVKGRIYYITSPARQENLYATYRTCDSSFWKELAAENRNDFRKSGASGTCIEAREFIIALPEEYTQFEPQTVLKAFTDYFKTRYEVECVSALHHNKTKTNYHIHLIFSERKKLPVPSEKRASRNMYFDENGRHVRTKKEVSSPEGSLREGCKVIKRGDIYSRRLFENKDPMFKDRKFLEQVKLEFTDLINTQIANEEHKLSVFQPGDIYLPMKKIGKNNPKEAEIKENNKAVLKWNEQAALSSEVMPKENIMEIKRREIQIPVSEAKEKNRADLFSGIVERAGKTLRGFTELWRILTNKPHIRSRGFDEMLRRCRVHPKKNRDLEWER